MSVVHSSEWASLLVQGCTNENSSRAHWTSINEKLLVCQNVYSGVSSPSWGPIGANSAHLACSGHVTSQTCSTD